MPEARTDVVIAAKSRGFPQVQQQTARMASESRKLLESQTKGFGKLSKGVGHVVGSVKSLGKAISTLGTAMEASTRMMERSLDRQADKIDRQQKRIQRHGAFSQGLLQGAVPGMPFLQRGPGMGRQVAGMAVGRAARGFATGMASSPFTGLSGLMTAAQAIPGGGLAAGQLQVAAELAQQALGLQRQRMNMAGLLGGGGLGALESVRSARASARAGVRPGPGALMSEDEIARRSEAARQRAMGEVEVTPRMRESMERMEDYLVSQRARDRAKEIGGEGIMARAGRMIARTEAERGRPGAAQEAQERVLAAFRAQAGDEAAAVERADLEAPGKRFRARRRAAGRRAAARAKAALFAPFRGAGMDIFGENEAESLQRAQGMLTTGGGSLGDLRRSGLLRTGFAAQSLVPGLSGGTVGAFLQASRRGGLSGLAPGSGGGGEALTSAIADAMKLGLEGSEVNEYLAQMAEGITQWRSTGIPMAKEAIAGFGMELGKLGLGGVRGSAVARGVVGAAQGLSTRGPTNAAELMLMQVLGGLQPGKGGSGAFEEAQIQMEQLQGGGVGGKQIRTLFQRLIKGGGGGASGRLFARQALGQMGVRVGAREMKNLGGLLESGAPDADFAAEFNRIQQGQSSGAETAPTSPGQLQQRAMQALNAFGSGLKTQAKIQNEQMMAGRRMIPFLNNLNSATTNVADGFTTLAGEPLTELTKKIRELTEALSSKDGRGLMESLSDFLSVQ